MKVSCIVKLRTYTGANGKKHCPVGCTLKQVQLSVLGLCEGEGWKFLCLTLISEPLRTKMLGKDLEWPEELTGVFGTPQLCKSNFPWMC